MPKSKTPAVVAVADPAALLAQLAALLAGSPAAVAAPVAPSPAQTLEDWTAPANVAALKAPAPQPRKADKIKAQVPASITGKVSFFRLSFNGKPSEAQRDGMKAAGGFAVRQSDTWFWFVPATK